MIHLPLLFARTLERSPALYSAVRANFERFEPWLEQSGMPFFPGFTDHSPRHISDVLQTAAALIPDASHELVTPEDVTVLCVAILLHDCGMHLTQTGLRALVAADGPTVVTGLGDVPWSVLWKQFLGEASRFGDDKLLAIFGGEMPLHFGYSFVGTTGGSSKMSGSAGGAPTPADALEIFEAPLVRWLYARRRPEQSFTIAFNAEVGRVYDEWDALSRKVADGTAEPASVAVYGRAAGTAEGPLPATPRPLPFRTLASVADITAGDQAQILRILRDLTDEDPVVSLDDVRPRLDCAQAWVAGYMDPADRTQVRREPDQDRLAGLSEEERRALKLLTERMGDDWSLSGLTTLLYGIPKLLRDLPLDAPPTPELKAAQRAWFILLYQLLIGKDTGPRLPTLLLALGQDQIRHLLTPG